jgi:hypothetical protein
MLFLNLCIVLLFQGFQAQPAFVDECSLLLGDKPFADCIVENTIGPSSVIQLKTQVKNTVQAGLSALREKPTAKWIDRAVRALELHQAVLEISFDL